MKNQFCQGWTGITETFGETGLCCMDIKDDDVTNRLTKEQAKIIAIRNKGYRSAQILDAISEHAEKGEFYMIRPMDDYTLKYITSLGYAIGNRGNGTYLISWH